MSIDNIAATLKKDEVVQMWAFRGGRGETKAKVLDNPDPNVRAEAYTGHVGVSLDGGKSIYGFGPKVSGSETKRDVIDGLSKKKSTYPGTIHDDTVLFSDIMKGKYDPADHAPIDLYTLDIPTTAAVRKKIGNAIQQGDTPDIRYGFPKAGIDGVENCATFFGTCGLDLPLKNGNLRDYIPAMIDKGAIKITK